MLCKEGIDLSDFVQCKPARSSSFFNVVFESRLVIGNYTKISDWNWWSNCRRTGWWNNAVESEWQGWQEAPSLPGWAVGDVLSSMQRCPLGSLRSVQLPLDHLVEMRDRAVCHQHSNGTQHSMMGPSDVVYVEKRRGPRTDAWGTPVTSWCSVDTSPPQTTLKDLPLRKDSNQPWNPCDAQWWVGGQEDLMLNSVKSSR